MLRINNDSEFVRSGVRVGQDHLHRVRRRSTGSNCRKRLARMRRRKTCCAIDAVGGAPAIAPLGPLPVFATSMVTMATGTSRSHPGASLAAADRRIKSGCTSEAGSRICVGPAFAPVGLVKATTAIDAAIAPIVLHTDRRPVRTAPFQLASMPRRYAPAGSKRVRSRTTRRIPIERVSEGHPDRCSARRVFRNVDDVMLASSTTR